MTKLKHLTLAVALGLCGCNSNSGTPDFVQKMIDAPFPADGQIHVQSVGKFEVKPQTVFCNFPNGDHLNSGLTNEALDAIFRELGQQPDVTGGSWRGNGIMGRTKECSEQFNPVVTQYFERPNRSGKPYKLVLAVWQGKTAWIGEIERPDGIRKDQGGKRPFRDGIPPPSWIRDSQDRNYQVTESQKIDVNDLSNNFVKTLISGVH